MKKENKVEEVLGSLVEESSSVKEKTIEDFLVDRFKENLDIKRVAKVYIELERDAIKQQIRLLKTLNSNYEKLNKSLSSLKTSKEIINFLGEDSVIVQSWNKYFTDKESNGSDK